MLLFAAAVGLRTHETCAPFWLPLLNSFTIVLLSIILSPLLGIYAPLCSHPSAQEDDSASPPIQEVDKTSGAYVLRPRPEVLAFEGVRK